MLKKTITYVDYDNNTRTEDHYFNLSNAEIMELQLSTAGGLDVTLQNIIKAQDMPELIKIFKNLIRKSYGIKSPDGKRMIKSDEIFKEFEQTEAYSTLFMELATDSKAASEFINGIIPKDIDRTKIDEEAKRFLNESTNINKSDIN